MMRKSRKLQATALALAGFMFLSACGDDGGSDGGTAAPGNSGGGGESGGDFIDGGTFGSGVPPHIDPLLVSELDGAQVSTALYDGLTEFEDTDDGPVLKPLVAESYEANDDATEFVFTIKDGRKFSDGTDVLPSSFARGWNIAANPELAADYSYLFGLVEGFDEYQDGSATELSGVVADDGAMTLTVTLKDSYADFPSVVSHIIFSPMPEARDALTDQSQWERQAMIGNGPFMQEVAMNDQEIKIVRNPNWGGDVYGNTSATLDSVTFKTYTDLDAAYASFEAGETMNATIPSGKFAEATGKYGNTAVPQLASYHWVFGMRDSDVIGGAENAKLRQAMSLAMDREAINDAVYDGSRALPSGVTPPGIPGFTEDLCDYCVSNMDDAKALLKEFTDDGGTIPTGIKLVFNAGAGHEDVAAIVQQNLEELGVSVEQEPRSSETYFKSLREGGCPGLCRAGWFWDYPIYDNGMYDLFHSDSIGGNNLGFYSSPEFDEKVAEARKTVDTDKREALFVEAEDILLNQDTAVAPINWYNGDHVYADNIGNYHQEALGWVRYETLTIS